MKLKQMAMDAALADLDRYELEREKRETDAIKARLDDKYERIDRLKLKNMEYTEGSVVIIAQNLFRDGHYKWHFYRTVMTYHPKRSEACRAFFVESRNEEFPERPPWADTVGHEDDPRDIDFYPDMIHWITGEIEDPIKTWAMKRWERLLNKGKGGDER
jgi:hypothetical protein